MLTFIIQIIWIKQKKSIGGKFIFCRILMKNQQKQIQYLVAKLINGQLIIHNQNLQFQKLIFPYQFIFIYSISIIFHMSSNTNINQKQAISKQAVVLGTILTLSAIVGAGYLYTAQLKINQRLFKFVEFDFYTYCPDSIQNGIHYYRVQIHSKQINNQTVFFYCGLATVNKDNCGKAEIICTTPGPKFDVYRNQQINVQWINNINKINLENSTNNPFNDKFCNQTIIPQLCIIEGHKDPLNPQYSCDPSDILLNSSTNLIISRDNVPITTHIHGLETQGKFDGNPTSWWTKNGSRGLGFYYNSEIEKLTANAKNNTYRNTQTPGTLWYHDHPMHLTKHNVNQGLLGMYIIRDLNIEKDLPQGQFEKYFVFSQRTQNYTNLEENTDNLMQRMRPMRNPRCAKILKSKNLTFTKNVYRIRMLNGYFKSFFTNLQFVIFDKNISINKNFTKNKGLVNFTIIGTDSSLMQLPQYNVQKVSLASAERLDILINFNLPILNSGDIVSLLALSEQTRAPAFYINITINEKIQFIKELVIALPDKNQKMRMKKQIKEININRIKFQSLYFDNLTKYTPSNYRFRTLVHTAPPKLVFAINSHAMYTQAESENPIIGSIQDWVLINTMVDFNIPHPIHIHLINYQIIAQYNLLNKTQIYGPKNTSICTLYALDYYSIDSSDPFGCLKSYPQDFHKFADNFSETNSSSVPNLFQSCAVDSKNKYIEHSCKYIESNISNHIQRWYKSWKEVAMVKGGKALHLRIRWARTDYNKALHDYNYFSHTNESITSLPGFLYHCHFLDHQDNEMMRPIMLIEQNKKTICQTKKIQEEHMKSMPNKV